MRPISTRKPCTTPRRPRQAMTCMRSMTNGCRGGTTWASPNSKALPGPSSASARNGTNANNYADTLPYAGKRPKNGKASCREKVGPNGYNTEVSVYLKQTKQTGYVQKIKEK